MCPIFYAADQFGVVAYDVIGNDGQRVEIGAVNHVRFIPGAFEVIGIWNNFKNNEWSSRVGDKMSLAFTSCDVRVKKGGLLSAHFASGKFLSRVRSWFGV